MLQLREERGSEGRRGVEGGGEGEHNAEQQQSYLRFTQTERTMYRTGREAVRENAAVAEEQI